VQSNSLNQLCKVIEKVVLDSYTELKHFSLVYPFVDMFSPADIVLVDEPINCITAVDVLPDTEISTYSKLVTSICK
jgi:hypothetical protein